MIIAINIIKFTAIRPSFFACSILLVEKNLLLTSSQLFIVKFGSIFLNRNCYSSYDELVNGIKKWRLAYTFSSPFKGKLEYLNFWRENDFIAADTPVLSVIPSGNALLGQVYLPSQGAGKVIVGQEVIIRLDNYPYMEYGSIAGKVRMISTLSNQTEEFAKKNDLQTYLITVDLPNKLTTNYGTTLDFNYEIKGVADILTKKRKLLLRLFDNLKYIASKKSI